MTEEQIKHGYERLDSGRHAPMDAFDRVERRMAVRRRQRRAGIAVGTAAAVAVVGGYVAVSSGGSDGERDSTVVAVEPPPSTLVMTRPDGSTYEFEDITISCDPPSPLGEGGEGGGDGSRVYLSSPIRITGERVTQPFVLVQAVVEGFEQPRTLSLPLDDSGGSEDGPPLMVFIADTEGAPDGNEVVAGFGSTGTLTITRASCDPTPVLELEVDATLASEEQTDDGQAKQSLVLQGAMR